MILHPKDWDRNIVQGKTYDASEPNGLTLFEDVQDKLKYREYMQSYVKEDSSAHRYGKELLIKPRIGQGAFKVLIIDAYQIRCVITGGKTLPVLEAAHIKPFCLEGPHAINNGLLLR